MPSRRQLLPASALASGLGALGLTTATAQAATSGPVCACVGTYSDGGKPWRGGRGLGVHQFVRDGATGALKPIPGAPPAVASTGNDAKLRNPASRARHPKLPMLCAANGFEAGPVFRVDKGGIQFSGQYVAVGSAAAIEFSS